METAKARSNLKGDVLAKLVIQILPILNDTKSIKNTQ